MPYSRSPQALGVLSRHQRRSALLVPNHWESVVDEVLYKPHGSPRNREPISESERLSPRSLYYPQVLASHPNHHQLRIDQYSYTSLQEVGGTDIRHYMRGNSVSIVQQADHQNEGFRTS